MRGTGLAGQVYAPGSNIRSIDDLRELIDEATPDLRFTATELAYGARDSDTTVAEFLDHDAGSLSGNGDAFEMGPSGLVMKGFIFVPEGVHEIKVTSDDGFDLKIGGLDFSSFQNLRAADETARVAEFEGGLYEVELLYFDAYGQMELMVELDGMPIDQSAFYRSVDDFMNPPAGVETVPVADYHPSFFLGEEVIDDPGFQMGRQKRDVIDGQGGDDTIGGAGGEDEIKGGYGDDKLMGGAGDDVLDGGRGSDLLIGGDGNDLLISRSDAGEQRIGQVAIGAQTRGDPDDEVNWERQKLKGYENQPLIGDDIMVGGAGRDTFLISPQINAKLDIIQKHVRADGTINWAGVAGENDELHDHWVDSFGIDVIADYNRDEDQIAIIGHTANICDISYRDIDGDGYLETIITVDSDQGGPCVRTGAPVCGCMNAAARGGGAHDQDLIGQIIVHGDLVYEDDIILDAGVTYGIVQTYAEVAEALVPIGETKVTEVNGELVYGYDTRGLNGYIGEITGDPENHIDNPYLDQVTFENPTPRGPELTRDHFEPLGFREVAGETRAGNGYNNKIGPQEDVESMPGALGFWSFKKVQPGVYDDASGGPSAKAYRLYENQALLRTDGGTRGPDGGWGEALHFNGEDEFAFIETSTKYQITQGTIALWVRPEDLSDESIFVSRDQSGTDDGGHFHLGHTDDGGLILRMAPGDGGSNTTWETGPNVLREGQWSHLAVNFTEDGITVFKDGRAISDRSWTAVEGGVGTPGQQTEAYMLRNSEPWVLGADTSRTQVNGSAATFAADDDKLSNAYEGAIADFGIWGGFTLDDVLTYRQINRLVDEGPGGSLQKASGPQKLEAGNDFFRGGGGNDTISGEAGDDRLKGDGGNDFIEGGYGNDKLMGDAGNDTLDGGRGGDWLIGGAGDDLLISRSDAGEQRIGQLVIDDPSRTYPDPSVDDEYLKLVDWIDQPLAADDVLVGGEGRDHFYFEALINAKLDILVKHTMPDRMIHWHGVAGENRRLHDHWVDALGIEVIADFEADKDKISVVGHTAQVEVSYQAIDTDKDGVNDSAVSIIRAYSQQGNGGAHDEDLIGFIVVHGDLVREEDIITDPGVHFGIVNTIDEIQEAVAPSGERAPLETPDGEELYGYDTRDVEGDPVGSDPQAYSSNKFLEWGKINFADGGSAPAQKPGVVLQHGGGTFADGSYGVIRHTQGQAQAEGTWAFSFTANSPGEGYQALISKDHSGYKDGGHLTIYIDAWGNLRARLQSENHSVELKHSGDKIEAGETYDVALSFDRGQINLFVNGELSDSEAGFASGMRGNSEKAVIGASTRQRWEDDDRLDWFFDGTIEDILVLDRSIEPVEAILLADGGSAWLGLEPAIGTDWPELTGSAVIGSNRNDVLGGTEASEKIEARSGADRVGAGDGNDVVLGGDGRDVLKGGAGNDFIRGDWHDDTLVGGTGDDTLDGGQHDDLMEGSYGNDQLIGGQGADTLKGGDGMDVLDGGWGADAYTFDIHGYPDTDTVENFTSGVDKIVLDSSVFDVSGSVGAAFVEGTRARDADDRLIYDSATGKLFYDANGTGVGGPSLIARFGAGTEVNAGDIDFI
ncbi:MAG: LamG-like jellyroll fold domain-containing protein [Pseudomonadota bacterium]